MADPYRTSAPPEIDPPRPDPDRWLLRVIWTSLILVIALLGRKIYIERRDGPPPPSPCSTYADWPAKDVPARCTKNFDGDKP